MRKDILNYKNEILEFISQERPKAEICRFLNCKPQTLDRYLELLEISYKGNMGRKNIDRVKSEKPINFFLKKDKATSSHRLKLRLLKDGIKEHKCEMCNLTEWLNEPIPIELHHVDGDRFNNLLDNLQILCPNCHSKTPNNSGRGKSKKKIKETKEKKIKFCECGIIIKTNSKTCKDCYKRTTKVERPKFQVLINDISELGYSGTGRKYGVSDNAIRKWVKKYLSESV